VSGIRSCEPTLHSKKKQTEYVLGFSLIFALHTSSCFPAFLLSCFNCVDSFGELVVLHLIYIRIIIPCETMLSFKQNFGRLLAFIFQCYRFVFSVKTGKNECTVSKVKSNPQRLFINCPLFHFLDRGNSCTANSISWPAIVH